MRKIITFIIVGCISFVGSTVFAQTAGNNALESIRQSLGAGSEGAGGGTEGPSLSDRMTEMVEASTGAGTSVGEEAPIIAVPIIPDEIEVPEVNQSTATVLDTRGRYNPRLKINFANLPLRSLSQSNQTENGVPVKGEIPANIIVRQMKDRFNLSELHLSVKDRQATVSGTVDSDHQRDMIALMFRFVPGIDSVQNEIIVSSSP